MVRMCLEIRDQQWHQSRRFEPKGKRQIDSGNQSREETDRKHTGQSEKSFDSEESIEKERHDSIKIKIESENKKREEKQTYPVVQRRNRHRVLAREEIKQEFEKKIRNREMAFEKQMQRELENLKKLRDCTSKRMKELKSERVQIEKDKKVESEDRDTRNSVLEIQEYETIQMKKDDKDESG
ncbi:hypothetical protein Tco_0785985 [Tanacetum coccineum]